MRIPREDEGSGHNDANEETASPGSPKSPGSSASYTTPQAESPTSLPELVPVTTVHTHASAASCTGNRIDRRSSRSSTHSQNWIGADRSEVEREWPRRASATSNASAQISDGRLDRRSSWSSTHSQNWMGADRSEAEKEWPRRERGALSRISSHDSENSALSRRLSRSRSQNTNGLGIDAIDEADRLEDEGFIEENVEAKGNVVLVRWDGGDNDPMNPRRFSSMRKWAVVWINSFSALCVSTSSSIYVTTYDQMNSEFGNSREVGTVGLSLFVFGLATGPLVLAPLSEFYGRRPVYLVSYAMFLIWLIPSAVAKNIATMLVARFLCGFSGSAFLSVSGGSVGDMFVRDKLQSPMMVFTGAPFLGPALGPIIGGFINEYTYWRWTYYVLLIWAGIQGLLLLFFVPETYHPALLRKKARMLRKSTGDERYKSPMELQEKSLIMAIAMSLYRPMQLLTKEFMVQALCLYSAILLGILYLFFGAFPLIFRTNHSFSLHKQGLSFTGIFVGMIIAILSDPIWHRNYNRLIRNTEKDTNGEGESEPEFRLPPAIAGSVLVPIGMFWFGWTTYSSVHWVVPILGSVVFGAGTLLIYSGVFTFLVDAYPLYAASALAANLFARCSFAAIFPLFGIQMYTKLGFQWATTLLALLMTVMMPFPYLFFVYGRRIRNKSRFASGDEMKARV